jgi:peptidoglycan hydrolase CwlO-like protein
MPDAPRYEHSPWIDGAASLASSLPLRELEDEGEDDANMTKVRVLLGLLAVLVFVGSATGCGLVSDQTKQEAKKKVESKAQQAKQEVKKKIEVGQEDLQKKVDDLKKKVDDVQKDVNDLQKKVDELLKKVDAQKQQDQKAKK